MGLTRITAQQISNIDYKQSVRAVTTTNITLAGGAPSTADSVSLAANDRILVTGQTTGSQNGLYYVTTLGNGSNGTWTRSTDGDTTGEIDAGMIVLVTEGTVYADTQWKLTTNDPITIGTTTLTFVQNYSANSISAGTSNVSVGSSANVTVSSAGTANVLTISSTGTVVSGTESVTGNITGGNILTGGLVSATGSITGASVVGGVITGSSVSVTGNVTGVNHFGTNTSVTGTTTAASVVGGVITGSSTSVTGTVTAATVNAAAIGNVGAAITAATVSAATIGNASAVLNGTTVSVTGTVTAASVVGGVITGSSTSVTGTTTAASVVGGVITGSSVSVTGAVTGTTITGTSVTVSTGSITGGNIINANGNGVGNIGSSTVYFNTVFAKATSAQYADVAEKYIADADYPVGTVLRIGGTYEVSQTDSYHGTNIVGTVSDKPAYVMNSGLAAEHVAVVALLGRVPCRVTGKISKGDLLVSSKILGVAAALDPDLWVPGCVIGKALEDYDSITEGVIEIVVGRS